MAWDLSNYEDVATLNKWFQDNYPAGRIHLAVEHLDTVNQEIFIRCDLYRDSIDTNPAVTNFARGRSSDYPKNMQRWWVEDTSTSAIGRAILLIKAADKTATKDSMIQVAKSDPGHKVEHPWKPAPEAEKIVENEPETYIWPDEVETKAFADTTDIVKALGAEVVGFKCKHGDMLLKDGTSAKGPYHGYVCGAKAKADQCPAKWAKQVQGKWTFEAKAID
jgi:hypothetical protein